MDHPVDSCHDACMTEQPIPADVHAEALFTADHAAVHSGKLYVHGGFWTRLNFASFPASHSFSVCVVLHIPWREHPQDYSFAISFEDAGGQPTPHRFEGRYQAGALAETRPGDFIEVPIALQVANFVFQRPGDYAVVLQVDGKEIRRSRLSAVDGAGVQQATPPRQVADTDAAGALVQQWEQANEPSALVEQWEEAVGDEIRKRNAAQRASRR
jgi:hypothetical protein